MKITKRHWLMMLWAALSLGALGGCGDAKDAPNEEEEETIYGKVLSFTAEPEEVMLGEATTLSWRTENAPTLQLFEGEVEIPLSPGSIEEGELEVVPESSTRYSLLVKGEEGLLHDEAEVFVRVSVEEGPEILSFTADPAEIEYGESSTLRWEVAEANSVVIMVENEVIHEGGLEGSLTLEEVEVSTTYTLVALAEGEQKREELTLLVKPRILLFEADLEKVTGDDAQPGRVTLTYEVEGALGLDIWANGSPWRSGIPPTSMEVDVPFNVTFTLVALGGEGAEARADVRVEVLAWPEVTIEGPVHLGAGDPFTLSWESQNATSLSIFKDEVELVAEAMRSGSLEQSIDQSATYTFRASNSLGAVVEESWEVLVAPPEILRFEAAESTTADSFFEVSWETVGGTYLEITDAEESFLNSFTEPIDIEGRSFQVRAPGEAGLLELELRVENGSGQSIERAEVEILPAP